MSAHDAEQQFDDNLQYADTPEKQNLYNGLANVAAELQRISANLHRIEQVVEQLGRKR